VRLTALVESEDHVCARYRLQAFRPHLNAAGHALDLAALSKSWWQRLAVLRSHRDADIVVLQRKLLSRAEVAILRRNVRRLWFDMDDALWLRDSYSGKSFASRKRRHRLQNIVRVAELVIAGNSYLAEQAKHLGAKATQIIPTCVDVRRYPSARHERATANLVWVGSSITLRGLEAIAPILNAIGDRLPNARLKLVCDRFFQPGRLPIVECPWSEEREADEIAAADIGISWIPDDPWSRGKCGLKVLQYMAAGLPVVTNRVGVHAEMVVPGETGFLASTETEWADAIATLAADPDLRRRMGAAARALVEARYSVEAGAALWRNLIEDRNAGRGSA
jgi:glycosyltransferase involved in cell wall biosynthesis